VWSRAQHPLLALRQERSERHLFLSEPGSQAAGAVGAFLVRCSGLLGDFLSVWGLMHNVFRPALLPFWLRIGTTNAGASPHGFKPGGLRRAKAALCHMSITIGVRLPNFHPPETVLLGTTLQGSSSWTLGARLLGTDPAQAPQSDCPLPHPSRSKDRVVQRFLPGSLAHVGRVDQWIGIVKG